MNDDFLTRQRRSPRPEFAAALYRRITEPVNPQPVWFRWRRPALAFGIGLLALALVAAATPPARAWAATVLRQIGLISVVETASPPADLDPNAPPPPTSTPIPADRPAVLTTVEQISKEAGFQPLVPAHLPQGYAQADLGAMEYLNDAFRSEGMGTFFRYEAANGVHFLEVQQSRFTGDAPQELVVGDVPVVDVVVRGTDGVWLERLPQVGLPNSPINMLLWWEDGFAFAIQSDILGLDDLLAVAESLGP